MLSMPVKHNPTRFHSLVITHPWKTLYLQHAFETWFTQYKTIDEATATAEPDQCCDLAFVLYRLYQGECQ